MRRRDRTAAALCFCGIPPPSTSTLSASSDAGSLVVELVIELFELLLSTSSSGEVSFDALSLIREASEELEAIGEAQVCVNSIPRGYIN